MFTFISKFVFVTQPYTFDGVRGESGGNLTVCLCSYVEPIGLTLVFDLNKFMSNQLSFAVGTLLNAACYPLKIMCPHFDCYKCVHEELGTDNSTLNLTQPTERIPTYPVLHYQVLSSLLSYDKSNLIFTSQQR